MPTPDYTSSLYPRLGDLAKVTPFSERWTFAQSQRPHMERCIEQLKAAPWPEVARLGNGIAEHWFRQHLTVLFNVEESSFASVADIHCFYTAARQSIKALRSVDDYDRGAGLELNILNRLAFVFSGTPPTESELRLAGFGTRCFPTRYDDDELHSNSKSLIGTFQLEIASQVSLAMKRLRPDRTLPPVTTFELFLTEVDRWLSECDAHIVGTAAPVPGHEKSPHKFTQAPPSKNRQDDILTVIRRRATPLNRDEIRKELKLKSPGKLGHHLSWMVKQGILKPYEGLGYWPIADGIPSGV